MLRVSVTLVFAAGNSHATPPSNSMPRFSPPVNSDSKLTRMRMPEIAEADAALADEVEVGLAVVQAVAARSPR